MKKETVCRIFAHLPELKTLRLTLRRMAVTDAADMYAYAKREDVTRYLLWSPHPNQFHTEDYLRYIALRYAAGTFYDWGVTLSGCGKLIGTCGFAAIDCPNNSAEIGYVLNPEYWGQGIAAEAAGAVLSFGFGHLGLHRIEARFMEGNAASLRVMEKLGMRFEGYRRDALLVKGTYRTVGYCSLLAEEYRT